MLVSGSVKVMVFGTVFGSGVILALHLITFQMNRGSVTSWEYIGGLTSRTCSARFLCLLPVELTVCPSGGRQET